MTQYSRKKKYTHRRIGLAVLVFLLVLLPIGGAGAQKESPPLDKEEGRPSILINADRLQKWANRYNVRIIDVRSREAFKEGHLPNALSLPAKSLEDAGSRIQGKRMDDAVLAKMFGHLGIGRDSWVVIYDDRGGHLATRLFWIFHYFGHRRVFVLDGGIDKWKADRRPLIQGTVKYGSQTFPIDRTLRRMATADWILEHMNDPNFTIVDVRPSKMYLKGHVPGAISIPWMTSIKKDKTWKKPDELRAMFEKAGVTKDKNIVVYCQFGRMNAHTYVTLKLLGYPRVRSYDLSWAEWGTDPSLPKVTGTQK